MTVTTYKCDLCGAVIENDRIRTDDIVLRIKMRPSGGWQFEKVQEYSDLCDECQQYILKQITERKKLLSQIGNTHTKKHPSKKVKRPTNSDLAERAFKL